MQTLLSSNVTSITDLKRNPMAVLDNHQTVAVLNRNRPAFYLISSEMLAYYQELAEEKALNAIADERLKDLKAVEVSLDDL